MPNVPTGAAMPHPSSHRGTCDALSVPVCRANPEAWQPGVLLRAPVLGAALWRREKCCPHTWHGVFLWFRHLVLRASAGPLRDDGARVEVTGICPGCLLGTPFPRTSLSLPQAVAG